MTANPIDLLGQAEEQIKKPDDTDMRLWSVTTIIGILDKPGLLYWAAEQTARAALKSRDTWTAMEIEQGTDETIKWLRDARFRRGRGELSDTEFGTQIHKLCESYALTGTRPEITEDIFAADLALARQCFDQFDRWLDTFQPSYQATEVVVYHPKYGYAGTTDAFLTIGGVRFIVDYKASKKSYDAQGRPSPIYPETALQLAGYRFAEMAAVWRPRVFESFRRRYYALSHNEQELAVAVPEVYTGLGVKITPEHCIAYPVRCDERVFEAFLYCLECARWSLQDSRDAIGDPLLAPEVPT